MQGLKMNLVLIAVGICAVIAVVYAGPMEKTEWDALPEECKTALMAMKDGCNDDAIARVKTGCAAATEPARGMLLALDCAKIEEWKKQNEGKE